MSKIHDILERSEAISNFIELCEQSDFDDGFQVYDNDNRLKCAVSPKEFDLVLEHLKQTKYFSYD